MAGFAISLARVLVNVAAAGRDRGQHVAAIDQPGEAGDARGQFQLELSVRLARASTGRTRLTMDTSPR